MQVLLKWYTFDVLRNHVNKKFCLYHTYSTVDAQFIYINLKTYIFIFNLLNLFHLVIVKFMLLILSRTYIFSGNVDKIYYLLKLHDTYYHDLYDKTPYLTRLFVKEHAWSDTSFQGLSSPCAYYVLSGDNFPCSTPNIVLLCWSNVKFVFCINLITALLLREIQNKQIMNFRTPGFSIILYNISKI